MRNRVKSYMVELGEYRKIWLWGIFGISLNMFAGLLFLHINYTLSLIWIVFIFPSITLSIWSGLCLASSRIIQANKKLEEKNGL